MAEKQEARKIITVNREARGDFQFVEVVEAGLVLMGTEVKSIRVSAPSLKEAYVDVRSKNGKIEAFLLNMHIGPYSHGNIWNHEIRRERKLLLHGRQLDRLHGALTKEGLTIVPTQLYFLKGRVKVELALARGKKKADKRQGIKEREQNREMDRALKSKR